MKVFALSFYVCAMMVLCIGCDDATTMVKPAIEDRTVAPESEPQEVGMVSQMKEEPVAVVVVEETEEVPEPVAEPESVEVTEMVVTPPRVLEVAYYSDWQLTQPLTGAIRLGTTIYTKVVFSEPMQHVVSDGADALPALGFVIGEKSVRYRMKPHGASGEDFQSGDCKPLHGGTDDYLCTYTVQAGDEDVFTLHAGETSKSAGGVALAAAYTHAITLTLAEEPEVLEITHYGSRQLTEPLDVVFAGDTVWTKVVFAGDVSLVVANDSSAVPDIRYVVNGREARYDVVRGTLRSGDCKPIEGARVFVCRYKIPVPAIGDFSVNHKGVMGASLPIVVLAIPVVPPPAESIPQESEPVPVVPVALTAEAAWDEAVAIIHRVIHGHYEIQEYIRRTGDKSTATADNRAIFERETGLSSSLLNDLRFLHNMESPNYEPLEGRGGSGMQIAAKYLQISFQYPEKSDDELLDLYREAVRNGETVFLTEDVEEALGIKLSLPRQQ